MKKRTIQFKTLFLVSSLLTLGLTSCKKQEIPSNVPTTDLTPANKASVNSVFTNYKYIQNGQEIKLEDIDLDDDNTTLVYMEKSNDVYVFTNDGQLMSWAQNLNNQFGENLASSLTKLNVLKKYIADNQIAETVVNESDIPKDYNLFFESLFGKPMKSSINILHDQPNAAFSGSIWAPVSYPKLSWVNFNDKTSAITIAVSAVWLCRNNWYGGSKAFFGALSNTYTNIGFNNIASSVIKL